LRHRLAQAYEKLDVGVGRTRHPRVGALGVRFPLIVEVKVMEVPSSLQGDSLKRLLQGAAAGAAVAMIVGFNWGGWTLGSTVEKEAKKRADTAVVAALAPICVTQFRQAANASANLTELNKVNYAWDRGTFIERGGWATMPGSEMADSAVAKACAETLWQSQSSR
jgi:hypothetical protein